MSNDPSKRGQESAAGSVNAGRTQESLKRLMYRYRWAMFAILIAAYFFVYFHRMSVSVVGTSIIGDLGGTVGFLSSVYFWT